MTALALLERLHSKGVLLEACGDRLRFFPQDALTSEEVEQLRRYKPQVLQLLSGKGPLFKALAEKIAELGNRYTDLKSPYYEDDPWCKEQAQILQQQIANIRSHLEGTESLDLPCCCYAPQFFCLAATEGFKACVLVPESCGFSY